MLSGALALKREDTMRKFLLGTVALWAIAAPASAADLRVKAPAYVAPAAPPLYTWTGFYIGGHIGAAFRDNNNNIFGNNDDARFIGGGQIGADYQFSGSWLIGVEGQYSYVDRNNNPFLFPGGSFNQDLRGLASFTGRVGYTWGPGLIYFKGGYAYADMRNIGVGPFTFNDNRDGYTIGGGLEYMFAQNWSGKVEYQYFDFGRRDLSVGAPLVAVPSWREEQHTVKVGLNYRFNLASPFTARY